VDHLPIGSLGTEGGKTFDTDADNSDLSAHKKAPVGVSEDAGRPIFDGPLRQAF
jgi:hypothetical protein